MPGNPYNAAGETLRVHACIRIRNFQTANLAKRNVYVDGFHSMKDRISKQSYNALMRLIGVCRNHGLFK